MQTVFPVLRYQQAREAIRWLCNTFGFVELFSFPPTGAIVRHAQLQLGTNIIMVGSVRPGDGLVSPAVVGAATQALCVYIADVDNHHARAVQAGAHVTSAPTDTDFGAREYHVVDIEGHPWTFGNYLPRPGQLEE